jgi:tripartite-type tricarboxylate transporter receptor subunit TctC
MVRILDFDPFNELMTYFRVLPATIFQTLSKQLKKVNEKTDSKKNASKAVWQSFDKTETDLIISHLSSRENRSENKS